MEILADIIVAEVLDAEQAETSTQTVTDQRSQCSSGATGIEAAVPREL